MMKSFRLWLVLPAAILVLVIAAILWWRPFDRLAASSPPVENSAIETVRLSPGLISLVLRTDGSVPVVIGQVQVDGAYRKFIALPSMPSAWLGRTQIDIPYPWIEGEAHHIALVTQTGAVIEHTIEVAQLTPSLDLTSIWTLALVGILLGVVPVATGLLTWPAMRSISPAGMNFLLALTIGLLAFLLIDTIGEGLESAGKTIDRLKGGALFWVVLTLTTILLLALGRRGGAAPEGLRLAGFIALGIGLHNLGEGLAVGAALATGEAALATFLVVGFTIHNVTEGIGIAAPLAHERPSLLDFAGLAALAGLPAVAGTIVGTQAVSPLWIAVCFAVGAGAILQVIIEVGALIMRRAGTGSFLKPAVASGVVSGLVVMYATALLV
jgi:zinc transporter, ZIP family